MRVAFNRSARYALVRDTIRRNHFPTESYGARFFHTSGLFGMSMKFSGTRMGPASPAPTEPTGTVLPGINLGMRVANPSAQFPATLSDGEPLPQTDPRVEWKEHFCSEKQLPYYHNVRTNEVSFSVPRGFVTRFPRLHERNGQIVDKDGAVFPSKDNTSEAAQDDQLDNKPTTGLSPKQKLAAYGAAGMLWYLIVHNLFLACVFSSIYFFHIDLLSLVRSYGFHVAVVDAPKEKKNRPSFWRSLLVAIVLNKLLVPVQVVVTLATAPRVIHILRPIAARVGPQISSFFKGLRFRKKAVA